MGLKKLLTTTNSEVKNSTEIHRCFPKASHVCPNNITPRTYMIFWLWVKDRKKSFSFTDFKWMTGEIHDWQNLVLSHHEIETDAITDQPQPWEGCPAPLREHSLTAQRISSCSCDPLPEPLHGDTRLELLILARPICSTHWGLCFLQGAFQHLEICHGDTGGCGKDSPASHPPVTGVFLLGWLFLKDVSTQGTVCCSTCSLSHQTWVTASVLFHSDLWWLHYLPRNRKVLKRSALKVPILEIWTNWNEQQGEEQHAKYQIALILCQTYWDGTYQST